MSLFRGCFLRGCLFFRPFASKSCGSSLGFRKFLRPRWRLAALFTKLSGSGQKVRRAQMLLRAMAGTGLTDGRIVDAFDSPTRAVVKRMARHLENFVRKKRLLNS